MPVSVEGLQSQPVVLCVCGWSIETPGSTNSVLRNLLEMKTKECRLFEKNDQVTKEPRCGVVFSPFVVLLG